jgi:hypothetical protein
LASDLPNTASSQADTARALRLTKPVTVDWTQTPKVLAETDDAASAASTLDMTRTAGPWALLQVGLLLGRA